MCKTTFAMRTKDDGRKRAITALQAGLNSCSRHWTATSLPLRRTKESNLVPRVFPLLSPSREKPWEQGCKESLKCRRIYLLTGDVNLIYFRYILLSWTFQFVSPAQFCVRSFVSLPSLIPIVHKLTKPFSL